MPSHHTSRETSPAPTTALPPLSRQVVSICASLRCLLQRKQALHGHALSSRPKPNNQINGSATSSKRTQRMQSARSVEAKRLDAPATLTGSSRAWCTDCLTHPVPLFVAAWWVDAATHTGALKYRMFSRAYGQITHRSGGGRELAEPVPAFHVQGTGNCAARKRRSFLFGRSSTERLHGSEKDPSMCREGADRTNQRRTISVIQYSQFTTH